MAERYIDANALKAEIRKQPWKPETKVVLAVDWICGLIDDAPTADVEPIVRAEWIGPTEDERRADPHAGCREWYGPVYACSKCGCTLMGKDRYCPHCGAHMEGGK